MSRYWVNLKQQAIPIIGDAWYHLDESTHYSAPPYDAVYRDPERRICTRSLDNFHLFYLLNDIEVTPPPCLTTDVGQVPAEDLYRLSNFSLEGLFTKVRILKIIDANHLEIAFYVPSNFISKYRPAIITQNRCITRRGIPYFGDHGFFMRERCVLKNIATVQETPILDRELKKQLGLELLATWCNSIGNIAYAEFYREGEFRDRPIVLYNDIERSFSINHELIKHKHPNVGDLFPKSDSMPHESYVYEDFLIG